MELEWFFSIGVHKDRAAGLHPLAAELLRADFRIIDVERHPLWLQLNGLAELNTLYVVGPATHPGRVNVKSVSDCPACRLPEELHTRLFILETIDAGLLPLPCGAGQRLLLVRGDRGQTSAAEDIDPLGPELIDEDQRAA